MGNINEPVDRHVKDSQVVSALKAKLSAVPELHSEQSIYRVPTIYRKTNEDAYTPQLVSIGPLHHGAESLQHMEVHKLRYLNDFLKREPEQSMEYYVQNMNNLEERARRCYGEPVCLTKDEFLEMMLLDGCFVIEFMLKSCEEEPKDDNDPIFSTRWMEENIIGDLLLLENQLPFFVLERLFNLINGSEELYWSLTFLELTLHFFSEELKIGRDDSVSYARNHFDHFIDVLLQHYTPSSERVQRKGTGDVKFIPTVTELREAGVKFQRSNSNCFTDITFKKGVFYIPRLRIDGGTENLFRNFIAFEYFNKNPSYLSDYVTIMDNLINTTEDVALLRRHGIINNRILSDDEVLVVFNKIKVIFFSNTFYYGALYEDVDAYYNGRWHQWQEKLNRDYFNSPWSVLALIAAVIVLICSVTQTVCSGLALK